MSISTRILFSILMCLIFQVCLSGQSLVDSFDIATYARPDLERLTKQIQPRFNGDFNFRGNNTTITSQELGGNLSVLGRSTKFINSQEYQIQQMTSYNLGININRNNIENEAKTFSISPNYRTDYQKKFFKPDQRFLEIGVDAAIENNYSDVHGNGQGFSSLTSIVQFSLPIYRGKGRIEIINDAWLAVQILNILEEQQLIKRNISSAEVEDFANTIADIKNLRNTDFRLERIAEYERLVGFLVENEMVKEDDYRFFAYLLDAYQFESFTLRRSGKEQKFGFIPGINLENIFSNQDALNRFINISSLALEYRINSYQPKNLVWQFNKTHAFQIDYRTVKFVRGEDFGIPQNSLTSFQQIFTANWASSWEVQYLPSQRTNYSLIYQIDYGLFASFNDDNNSPLSGLLRSSLNFTTNFYVSPQFRWTIDTGFSLSVSNRLLDDFNFFSNNYFGFSGTYFFY